MSVKDWSSTASSNTGILTGITLDGSVMNVPLVDDAFREMSAQIAQQMGKMNFKGADMPSAATVALDTATGWYVNITGTTTITSFGTVPAGQLFILRFPSALTIVYHASTLILPTAASIVTVGGDIGMFMSLGAGQWRCLVFTRPNSSFLDSTAVAGPSTADSTFAIYRSITDGQILIGGGSSSSTGAYIQLFGETHTTNARDIILGSVDGSGYRYFFDYSAETHNWANNTPTNTMNLNAAGDLQIDGQLTCDSIVQSTDAALILASTSSGTVYLRPNGNASEVEQATLNSNGDFVLTRDIFVGGGAGVATRAGGTYAGLGIREMAGTSATSYGNSWINFNYVSGTNMDIYIGTTVFNVTGTICDYRIKQEVQPLDSTWNQIKALQPISYRLKDYEAFKADDLVHWGFVAHEVEGVVPPGVTGEKDGEKLQALNPIAIIAALTKTVQEMQARIEHLEAPKNG